MKEDYLWDNTTAAAAGGETDAEIERLENVLQVFRYRETAPPALPVVNVLPFKSEAAAAAASSPRKRQLRFALAMAACLLFGIIALGAWFQILRNNIETSRNVAETKQSPQISAAPTAEIKQGAGDNQPAGDPIEKPTVKKSGKAKPSVMQTVFKIRKPAPRNDLVAQRKIKQAAGQPKVYLTDEERYAYNQLMLALSITSSKLKMVKDKAEGLDEKKAFVKTEDN